MKKIKVTHVITTLDVGGSETVLLNLMRGIDRARFDCNVITLANGGEVAGKITDLGIDVMVLDGRHSIGYANVLPRLARQVRDHRPDIVQTWMYHSDAIGALLAKTVRVPDVVWGLQGGELPSLQGRPRRRAGLRALASLSHRVPTRIVCCSHKTLQVHREIGYDGSRMQVIHNGLDALASETHSRSRRLKQELAIPDDKHLIGHVARFDPMKDHHNLLKAFALLSAQRSNVHLALVGPNVDADNETLVHWVRSTGAADRVHLLGPQNVAPLYPAFDVMVSSSAYGEGLPLALGEAMCAETPVVATDLGDVRVLIEDPKRVVPTKDPAALARALHDLLDLTAEERRAVGRRDRERVRTSFGVETMVGSFEDLYERVAGAS